MALYLALLLHTLLVGVAVIIGWLFLRTAALSKLLVGEYAPLGGSGC